MVKALLFGSMLAGFAVIPIATHAAGSGATPAQSLLVRADEIRNPPGSFSMRIDLSEYRQRALTSSAALVAYVKPAANSGQYNNLIRFLRPGQDANKLLLRNGVDLWFFDPASSASIRISPQARLLGQASNGDVMSTNLSKDYDATLVGSEQVADGSGVLRTAAHLTLKALRPDVTYARADYWIDSQNGQPVKALFRSAEGRLLKTAFFRKFQNILGKSRPTQTVIIDGLNPDWVTVMETSQYAVRQIPQAWLQRDYLPRFTGVLE